MQPARTDATSRTRLASGRRGFDLGKSRPASSDLGDDLLGMLVPYEALGIVIPVLGPDLDGLDEMRDRGEDSSAEPSLSELVEPALDEIQPGRTRGCEVQMPTCALRIRQPLGHRRCLVGREVVEHDVDVEVPSNVQVDELEEGGTSVALWDFFVSKSTSPVPRFMAANRSVVPCRLCHGSASDPAALHWQRRLGAIEGLDLGLLIETEDDSPLGRVQIEPDDIDQLLLEPGVAIRSGERPHRRW